MKTKAYIIAAVTGVMFSGMLSAQEWKNGFSFAGVSHDPVSAGLGFAGAASVNTPAWSAFTSPAAMSLSDKKLDVAASFQNWAPDGVKNTNIAAGASFKIAKFGIAAGFARNGGEKYDIVSGTGDIAGTFTPSDLQAGAALSYAITDWLSAGENAKFFSSELSDDDKFTGFGADVQAQAVFGDFRAALGVANVGSSMKSASGEKFSVPSSILAAGDWRGEFGKNGIEAMVDLNYYFSGSFTAAAGVQYDFRDMVFVRAGYHYGAKDAFLPSFATVGAGVKFFGVSVNAAYLLGNDVLKNTLTVGLGYSF